MAGNTQQVRDELLATLGGRVDDDDGEPAYPDIHFVLKDGLNAVHKYRLTLHAWEVNRGKMKRRIHELCDPKQPPEFDGKEIVFKPDARFSEQEILDALKSANSGREWVYRIEGGKVHLWLTNLNAVKADLLALCDSGVELSFFAIEAKKAVDALGVVDERIVEYNKRINYFSQQAKKTTDEGEAVGCGERVLLLKREMEEKDLVLTEMTYTTTINSCMNVTKAVTNPRVAEEWGNQAFDLFDEMRQSFLALDQATTLDLVAMASRQLKSSTSTQAVTHWAHSLRLAMSTLKDISFSGILSSISPALRITDANGSTALHIASEAGDSATVDTLLALGADVELEDESGYRPIHCAASQGNASIVKQLLEAGCNATAPEIEGRSPLLLAVRAKNSECVERLLWRGAQPGPDGSGIFPLHTACQLGLGPIVSILLQWGAGTSQRDPWGNFALHLAAQFNHSVVCHILVSFGALLESTDTLGRTPLHCAALASSFQAADALISLGSSSVAVDEDGRSVLALAAGGSGGSAKALAMVKLLIGAGPDGNCRAGVWKTDFAPLHFAVRQGYRCIVRLFLSLGVDPCLYDYTLGVTAITVACELDRGAILDDFLARVAAGSLQLREDEEDESDDGSDEEEGAGDMLCGPRPSADQRVRLASSASPLLQRVLDALDGHGASLLWTAASRGHDDCVATLLDWGCDVFQSIGSGRRAVHAAANGAHFDTLQMLIGPRGSSPIEAFDWYGFTPLHLACYSRNLDCVGALLKAGADPHACIDGGDSALAWAVGKEDHALVEMLTSASRLVQPLQRQCARVIHAHHVPFSSSPHIAPHIKAYIAQWDRSPPPKPAPPPQVRFATQPTYYESIPPSPSWAKWAMKTRSF